MKMFKKALSVMLAAAIVLSAVVLSVGAYTVTDSTGTYDMLEGKDGATFVYDFKAADGTLADGSKIFGHNSDGVKAKCAITEDGLTMYSGAGFTPNINSYYNEFALYDPDFTVNGQELLTVMAGYVYIFKVEWMRTDASADAAKYIGVGFVANSTNASLASNNYVTVKSQNITVPNVYHTTTLEFDCDELTYADGRTIGIYTNAEYTYIRKVTVTIIKKNEVGTPKADSVSVDFKHGGRDVYMPTTTSTDGAYNGASIDFVNDPLGTGRGTVYCATATARNNVALSLPNVSGNGVFRDTVAALGTAPEGFKMTNGVKYRVTFDIYVDSNVADDADGIRNIDLYNCDGDHIGYNGGTKKGLGGGSFSNSAVANGWTTVSYDVTANTATDTAPYLMMLISVYAKGDYDYSAKIYVDNVSIDALNDRPTGETDNYVRSIRAESGAGEGYVSAGIRFRGEIPAAVAADAAEIGFVAAPETLATGTWYDMSSGAPALSSAKTAVVTDKVYGTNGDNNQYQLLIKGLTKEDSDTNLKAINFDVVLYVKDASGAYTYYNIGTSSYEEVRAAYLYKDAVSAVKY